MQTMAITKAPRAMNTGLKLKYDSKTEARITALAECMLINELAVNFEIQS